MYIGGRNARDNDDFHDVSVTSRELSRRRTGHTSSHMASGYSRQAIDDASLLVDFRLGHGGSRDRLLGGTNEAADSYLSQYGNQRDIRGVRLEQASRALSGREQRDPYTSDSYYADDEDTYSILGRDSYTARNRDSSGRMRLRDNMSDMWERGLRTSYFDGSDPPDRPFVYDNIAPDSRRRRLEYERNRSASGTRSPPYHTRREKNDHFHQAPLSQERWGEGYQPREEFASRGVRGRDPYYYDYTYRDR